MTEKKVLLADSRHYLEGLASIAPVSITVLTLSAPILLLAWLAAVLAPVMLLRLVTASWVR